jgi:protein-disulfide isomerase
MASLIGLSLVACAPSASQLQKVMEDNPDVLFAVIKKHPDKFLQVVNEAAQAARAQEEGKFRDEENKKREEEFANPKKPEVTEGRAFKGTKDAPVTIIEYSDYQCPFCKRGHETMKQVLKEYPGKVRVIFKNFPIERIHPVAMIASQYYEAIALQDIEKANKFHDAIFDDQNAYSTEGEAWLKKAAKKVGADVARVAKDINGEAVKSRIASDMAEAEKFGFNGTPGYLVNGVSLKGAYPFEEFKAIIDKHLQKSGS